MFPTTRLRRLRYHPAVRELVRETRLSPANLILPLFVRPGEGVREPIGSMPGNAQLSPDVLVEEIREAARLGLGGVILFGIPEKKDALGSDAMSDSGIIAQAVRAAKQAVPDFLLVTDVCCCEYTDHGHCGAIGRSTGRMDVENDADAGTAGQAGVGPRPGRRRHGGPQRDDRRHGGGDPRGAGLRRLPARADHELRGQVRQRLLRPVPRGGRERPQFGDRRSYQMDPAAAADQAMREIELDLAEGADIVMVKPALPYLDIIRQARDRFPGVPLAAYNVSGEFSMVKAAAQRGWLDEQRIALECLTSIRRAGASIILTYWAKDAARWLAG